MLSEEESSEDEESFLMLSKAKPMSQIRIQTEKMEAIME
jgi:hypothetical protein